VLVTCVFLGHIYAHNIVINPDPLNLTFGGLDGTISFHPDQPTGDCSIFASTSPQADDLITVKQVGAQPAQEVVLTVHALRQPHGQSESAMISGSWRPVASCGNDSFSFAFKVTVTTSSNQPVIPTGGAVFASSFGAFSSITS